MVNQQRSTKSGMFKVGLPMSKIFDWLGVVVFTGSAIGAFLAHQYGPAYIFTFVAPLYIIHIICGPSQFIFDEESVTCKSMLATYSIDWREVNGIGFGNKGTLVLHGDNKRLLVPPPEKWSGPNKHEAYDLVQKKLKESGLKPNPCNTAFTFNKNVRVSRKNRAS
jgi:hypothetical protein